MGTCCIYLQGGNVEAERDRDKKIEVKYRPRAGHDGPRQSKGKLYSFCNLGARRGGCQRYAQAVFLPGKRPGTHCMGGLVSPRAHLDGCGKPRFHWDSILGPSNP